MKRSPNTLGPLVAYHGCDKDIGEAVLAGSVKLTPSTNEHDWLGSGIYFWVDSPRRGMAWALEQSQRKKPRIKSPFVLGALIYPGLCLNLTDCGVMADLAYAYGFLSDLSADGEYRLPTNSVEKNGILLDRKLDCAVIEVVHELRKQSGLDPYDTVYGFFEEGEAPYPGAGFKEQAHVQIAVRNQDCIIGYFRVNDV